MLETYREILQDVFDLPALEDAARRIRAREVQVDDVETRGASPFARSLVFAHVAAYLYEADAPLAERRAQALTLDRRTARDLLGQGELRELIDAEVIATLEAQLQGSADDRRARDPDELHDLLRRLGDLDRDEAARALRGRRRAPGSRRSRRSGARSGAHRRRDALDRGGGRGALSRRARRARAGRPAAAPARAGARSAGHAAAPLRARTGRSRRRTSRRATRCRRRRSSRCSRALEAAGVLVRGEFRPGGDGDEWCDAEVLRRIKRRTLASCATRVAPVDAATFARFLAAWHGLGEQRARTAAARRGARAARGPRVAVVQR